MIRLNYTMLPFDLINLVGFYLSDEQFIKLKHISKTFHDTKSIKILENQYSKAYIRLL